LPVAKLLILSVAIRYEAMEGLNIVVRRVNRDWHLYFNPKGVAPVAQRLAPPYPGKARNLISNPVRVAAGFDGELSGKAIHPKQFFKRQGH
jgi:hypothetical protein